MCQMWFQCMISICEMYELQMNKFCTSCEMLSLWLVVIMSPKDVFSKKDFPNTIKWFSICRIGTSWVNEHHVQIYIFVSCKYNIWFFSN